MNYKDIELAFEFAEEQARAIKTLHTFKCIDKPNFKTARNTLIAHLRTILSGAVPVITSSGIQIQEDLPQCISAFRTIAMQSQAYDQLLMKLPSDAMIEMAIRTLTLEEFTNERSREAGEDIPELDNTEETSASGIVTKVSESTVHSLCGYAEP